MGYAFPPFCLIGRCLKKVREEEASLLLVTPIWKSQPWYPALLELLVDLPRILPQDPELLLGPTNNPHPLITAGKLRLAAWRLSGIESRQQEFLDKFPDYWQQGGVMEQTKPMRVPGEDGTVGVRSNKLIHFHALSGIS